MAELFEMPKLGMDMEEGTVIKWRKGEKDAVKKGEILVEIETDKTTVEVESPCDGVVLKLYCAEGDTLPVRTPIAAIGAAGETPPEKPGASGAQTPQSAAPAEAAPPPADTPPAAAPGGRHDTAGRVRISPRARRLAEQNQVDISAVPATGPGGRIVEKDVRGYMARAAAGAQPAGKPAGEPAGDYELIPLTAMRRTIARRMLESTSSIPSFTLEIRVDMRAAIGLRGQLKAKNVKVSFHDIFAKCAAAAMEEHPLINASYSEEGIRQYRKINIGIAVAVEGGLVVPVVRDVGGKRISEIAADSAAVIASARGGKLSPEDMTGGRLTISNLGMYPLCHFTAIINPPESTILACAGIQKTPMLEGEQWVEVPTVSITATFDHRLIDGAYGAGFMASLKEHIEDPISIIL